MVASGYLRVDPQQYEHLFNSDDYSSSRIPPSPPWTDGGAANISASEDWLNYMKNQIGLQAICELVVGDILNGLKNLIKDPRGFFSGGLGIIWAIMSKSYLNCY